ncbi:Protein mago nashi [Savitreella phatthalungensis]
MADDNARPEPNLNGHQRESFYLRYYSGHNGRFGHEFLEFDFLDDGTARYANNSNYRDDTLIQKEFCVGPLVIEALKQIVRESEILKEDDSRWPPRSREGRQELEVRLGQEHINFELDKIGSLTDIQESDDPEGLRVFYYTSYLATL